MKKTNFVRINGKLKHDGNFDAVFFRFYGGVY